MLRLLPPNWAPGELLVPMGCGAFLTLSSPCCCSIKELNCSSYQMPSAGLYA